MPDANQSRKRHNDETRNFATRHKLLWDGGDLNYLMHHFREHDHSTALELGRTYEAVQSKRHATKLFKGGAIYEMPKNTTQKPITFREAMEERTKQIDQGAALPPTIQQVPGGWVVEDGQSASEIRGRNSVKAFIQSAKEA